MTLAEAACQARPLPGSRDLPKLGSFEMRVQLWNPHPPRDWLKLTERRCTPLWLFFPPGKGIEAPGSQSSMFFALHVSLRLRVLDGAQPEMPNTTALRPPAPCHAGTSKLRLPAVCGIRWRFGGTRLLAVLNSQMLNLTLSTVDRTRETPGSTTDYSLRSCLKSSTCC